MGLFCFTPVIKHRESSIIGQLDISSTDAMESSAMESKIG